MNTRLMRPRDILRIAVQWIALVGVVVVLSLYAVSRWGGKPESTHDAAAVVLRPDMRIADFQEANRLTDRALAQVHSGSSTWALTDPLVSVGTPDGVLRERVAKVQVLEAEHRSKHWLKIRLKFLFWFIFLFAAFVALRRGLIRAKTRKWVLLASMLLFGVVFGSDPSPMGTVKDAIVLYGTHGVLFLPRLVALGVFLATVVLANKSICAWGCQLGVLQDLVFRLNRNPADRRGLLPQWKPPFAIGNSIRVAVFGTLILGAVVWAFDVIGPIDVFKIYNPKHLGIAGAIAVAAVLVASLFVYRPWCHFICPFGLIGWMAEKISLFKVKVDYSRCEACGSCERACPSTAMSAILRQDRVIPDCFSCGNCIEVCPSKAISFSAGIRRPRNGGPSKATH